MTRQKQYNSNERSETDGSADDTAVLEPGLRTGMPIRRQERVVSPGGGLRRVHASLYTLQAYKRWMHQVRENWKSDKR
jgi:hypothetical protein